MATVRYYFQNAAAGYSPATIRGTWDTTASLVTKKADTSKAGEVDAASFQIGSAAANYARPYLRAVSEALAGNGTVALASMCAGLFEDDIGGNFKPNVYAYVTVGDTDAVRGVLINNWNGATEFARDWGTSGQALSPTNSAVAYSAGDRVVVLIGVTSNTTQSYWSPGVAYGSTDAFDLPDGGMPAYPGWFDLTLVAADTTAPVTTSDAKALYVDPAIIMLTATDAGSGVAHTYYTVDDGAEIEGTTVVVEGVGAHHIDFWSVDAGDNEETPHNTATFDSVLGGAPAVDYPRLGCWWPNPDTQSAASLAKFDWVALYNYDLDHIAAIRAANANIKVFGNCNALALNYVENDYSHALNVELRSASLRWALPQVGSTLSAAINDSTTTVPVHEVTKSGLTLFAAGDVFTIDEELFKVTEVNTLNLTVQRGTYMGTPAASHAENARAACIVSDWPGAIFFDATSACPVVNTTAKGGVAADTWSLWNARRLNTVLDSADLDGMLIDEMLPGVSGLVGSTPQVGAQPVRSIDPDRSNTILGSYTALDAAWLAGMMAQAAAMRTSVGPDAILLPNAAVKNFADLNGSIFEGFPTATTVPVWWYSSVFASWRAYEGTYQEWCAARSPSHAHIETHETDGWLSDNPYGDEGWKPDYQKMRYGLCTALMGDGSFGYSMATNGHFGAGYLWFDEYDNAGAGKGYLGAPLGPATLALPPLAGDLLSGDGAFADAGDLAAWGVYAPSGYAATAALDEGTAKIEVTQSAGANAASCYHGDVSLETGKTYSFLLRARASVPMDAALSIGMASAPWTTYLVTGRIPLTTEWQTFEIPCLGTPETDAAARLSVTFGAVLGTLWLDDVKLQEGTRTVYKRDFERGRVIVNAEETPQTVTLSGGTYRKINGTQDHTVNDGTIVTSVTLAARDGIVLLASARHLSAGAIAFIRPAWL